MRRWAVAVGGATLVVVSVLAHAAPLHAASVLVDLSDGQVLEQADPRAPIALGRTLDLLLIAVLRERLASGALTLAMPVAVSPVPGDRGPALAGRRQLPLAELLQLLLLVDSRTAALSLAEAAGPGVELLRTRLRRTAARLGLRNTTIPEDWPAQQTSPAPRTSSSAARTTSADVARVASAVWKDPEIRRRLALDGVPIADGAVIVRATAPLIALLPPTAAGASTLTRAMLADASPAQPGIASTSRDGLDLLAVATGTAAEGTAWSVLERGFERYQRVTVVRSGQRVGREVLVLGGSVAGFGAVAAEPFAITAPRGARGARGSLEARLQLPTALEAPIEVNQRVGELVLEQNGRIVAAVPLVAPLSIAPTSWFDTARR